jgi:hypothetical protein
MPRGGALPTRLGRLSLHRLLFTWHLLWSHSLIHGVGLDPKTRLYEKSMPVSCLACPECALSEC